MLVFREEDDGYTLLPFAFCPADTIYERQRREHELARVYRIRELAYDRWNSSMLINQLVNDGLNCVPVAQSNGAMNAPARELERVLAAVTLRHGANPILRWCAGNAIAHVDASGDIRPSKSRSTERIDLLVAALMGISRHLVAPSPLARQRHGSATSARQPRVASERRPPSVPGASIDRE